MFVFFLVKNQCDQYISTVPNCGCMNNTNLHADLCTFCSSYKPLPFVWLGAKPAWYMWDHVVKKHWLGLKPSEPLNVATFVYFEDCKQDFVTKFHFESPCSIFSCIRKNFFFSIPVLNYKARVGQSAGHWQGWSVLVIWLWSVKWTLFDQICDLKPICCCWLYGNRDFGDFQQYFFLTYTLESRF